MGITSTAFEKKDTLEQLAEKKRFQFLTDLLLVKERERLEQLEYYLKDPEGQAARIIELLPGVISNSDLAVLHTALNLDSTIKSTVIESIEDDAPLYADALYPVIFPAIKKSIAQAFKEMMQAVNVAIEQSLSMDRVSWHIEAIRSGVPYREVVLSHTLTYQVEQVFLIHRESGLLLRHSALAGLDLTRDSDAVSSMLTAIQDFIQDSFSIDESSQLDTVEIGEYTVYLTRGSNAVLACVIRGIPPVSLRAHFEETLQEIHGQYNSLLRGFDGDSTQLEVTEPQLQECLLSEKKNKTSGGKPNPLYFVIPLAIIFSIITYWGYGRWEFNQRTENYINVLQNTAGIVITSTEYEDGHLMLNGLYDPLLKKPDYLAELFNLTDEELMVHWMPYQSLESTFIVRRAEDLLQPPDATSLQVDDNILYLTGAASSEWIEALAQYTPASMAVSSIDVGQLKTYQQLIKETLQAPESVKIVVDNLELILSGSAPLSWVETLDEKLATLGFLTSYDFKQVVAADQLRLKQLTAELEQFYVYFRSNDSTLRKVQQRRIISMFAKIQELLTVNKQLKQTVTMIITGHTDSRGNIVDNELLAQKRAASFMDFLKEKDFTDNLKMIIKAGSSEKQMTNMGTQRKISLKFIFDSVSVTG